jgi:hypothetical protein
VAGIVAVHHATRSGTGTVARASEGVTMPVDLCFHPTDDDACTARAQAVPDHSGVCFHPGDAANCFHPGEADAAIHELLTATDAEALRFLASAS